MIDGPEVKRRQSSPAPPGVGSALLLVLLFALAQGLTLVLLLSMGGETPWLDKPTAALLTHFLIFPPLLWLGTRIARRSWGDCYPVRAFSGSIVAPILLASVGGAFLTLEFLTRIPSSELISKALGEALEGNRVSALVFVVLVGPIAEELLFRGWMLGSFLRRYSVRTAIVVSAVLFSASHVFPGYALGVFPLGLFFAWLVIKTGSLIPSVLAHVTVNATSRLWPFLLPLLGYDVEGTEEAFHFPLPVLGIALVLTVAGAVMLTRRLR